MQFNVIVVSSLLCIIITVHATPIGNHTCTGVVKHSVTVRVNVTEPVTYRTYTWCLRVPPRCSKYTVQLKDRVKIHTEMHNRTITVCCKGYVEMDYKCVPACPPQTECPNMHCNRTNHCYCTPGYQGLYCNYPCDRGFWGADCKKPCDCPDGYICHHLTGDCMLDDKPQLTTKYRRTTTTTVATISPKTTITQSTSTTAKPFRELLTLPYTMSTIQQSTEPSTNSPTVSTTEQPVVVASPSEPPTLSPTIPPTELSTVSTTQTSAVSVTQSPTISLNKYSTDQYTKSSTISSTIPDFKIVEEMRKLNSEIPQITTQIASEPITASTLTNNETETNSIATTAINDSTDLHKVYKSNQIQSTLYYISTEISSPNTNSQATSTTVRSVSTYIEEVKDQATETTILPNSPSTMQTIFTSSDNTSSTTTELPVTKTSVTVSMTTNEGEISQKTSNTSSSTLNLPDNQVRSTTFNSHFETSSSASPIFIPSTSLSTSFQTTNVPYTEITTSKISSESTIQFTANTIPTTSNPVSTSLNTSISPSKLFSKFVTVPSNPIYFSPTTISTKLFTDSNTDNLNDKNLFSSTISYKDNVYENKSLFDNISFRSNISDTQISNDREKVTEYMKKNISFKEENLPIVTSTGTEKINHTNVDASVTSKISNKILEILEKSENLEASTGSSLTNADTQSKTTISAPPLKSTSKKQPDEINRYQSTMGTSYFENQSEQFKRYKIKNFNSKEEDATDIEKTEITTQTYSNSDSITSTAMKSKSEYNDFEETTTTKFAAIHPPTSTIYDQVKIESVTKRNSKILDEDIKENTSNTTNNITIPILEPIENEKSDKSHQLTNTIRKNYRNDTNLISGTNEVSTKFGQTFFDLGKSVNDNKFKQRTEITTTLTTKEEPVMKNIWQTTNSRPAHTWYSHVKEYPKKFKNKDDTKSLKIPSNLDPLVVTEKDDVSEESNVIDSMHTTFTERGSKSNSGAPPLVNEESNIPSSYLLKQGQFNYNLSGALAEEVQAGKNYKSFFSVYSTSTLIAGIALILLLSTTTALWLCLRRKTEPTTFRGPCIMAYGPPSEFTLNPLVYETVYPLENDHAEGEQRGDPDIFFCPTFTNNYAERINRELSELNYDHPRSSICEPLYAEIRY